MKEERYKSSFYKPQTSFNYKYRTQLCEHFISTKKCPFGECCLFAHNPQQLLKIRKENKNYQPFIQQNTFYSQSTINELSTKIDKLQLAIIQMAQHKTDNQESNHTNAWQLIEDKTTTEYPIKHSLSPISKNNHSQIAINAQEFLQQQTAQPIADKKIFKESTSLSPNIVLQEYKHTQHSQIAINAVTEYAEKQKLKRNEYTPQMETSPKRQGNKPSKIAIQAVAEYKKQQQKNLNQT